MALPRPYRFPIAEWSRLRDRSFLVQQLGHLEVCGVFGITKKMEHSSYLPSLMLKIPQLQLFTGRDSGE